MAWIIPFAVDGFLCISKLKIWLSSCNVYVLIRVMYTFMHGSVTVCKLLLNWVKFPHKSCSVGFADLLWHIFSHERPGAGLSSSLSHDLSHGYVSTAHIPLTHYKSWQSQRCVSLRARGNWKMGRLWTTHELSISLTVNDSVTCLFPGVLREGHWHLDGGVSPVCVCCPARVRSS